MMSRNCAAQIKRALVFTATWAFAWLLALPAFAQQHAGTMPTSGAAPPVHHGGEASLVVPHLDDPSVASFFGGTAGSTLLYAGLGVCAAGMLFAFMIYKQLENAPVHKSMLEVSELIYETCKTYLVTQLKFIMILELFIGSIIVYYFGVAQH